SMRVKYSKFNVIQVIFLALFLLLLLLEEAKAQNQITFRQLSVKEGLSQNSAISITQDSTGYLWIATQDGLNKYDGKKFKVFPYNFVDITRSDYSKLGKVYTDKVGGLWVIPADKKPYKFNENLQVFEALTNVNDASVIFQDSKNEYWIGTYSEGLYHFDVKSGVSKQVLSPSDGIGTIYNIGESSTGDVFLMTENHILEFDKRTGKASPILATSIYGQSINANFSDIVFDSEKRQWIGTFGDGLYFRDDETAVFHRISELLFTDPLPSDLNILDLHIDSKGRLWIATYGRGLYMVNFGSLQIRNFYADKHNPKAVHYNDILCIYEDYSNTLWFGTDGAGVSYYDEYLEKFNSLTTHQTPENISIDVVRAIWVDAAQSIWIGTSGKGLTHYEPTTNSWRTFTLHGQNNGISSDRIMSLSAGDENELWIGTQGKGLDIFKEDEFTNFSKDSEIPLAASTIWDIHRDSKNQFWLATRENGLIQFDKYKGEVRRYMSKTEGNEGLPSNNIRVITDAGKGNFWLGTEADGIVFFDMQQQKFKTYKNLPNENSLSNDKIKSLYYDPKGLLWIGTNGGGLNVLDTNNYQFYNYTVEDGLANNVIYAILPDDEGNLWLSSNKGITKFKVNDIPNEPPVITNYDNYDGLATEFNTGAYHIDGNGNLYFGGLDGFYWFDPTDIEENEILPKTKITGLEVFDEEKSLTENLMLKHDENALSFAFSSLQFSLPEKNQYQYKLTNYDLEWIHSGNTNFARYSHLPPGDYEFMVKSSNYDGVWNEIPVAYRFSIAQPWFWNIWAKFMYVLILLAGIFLAYYYFRWRWRMKFELRQKEDEANRLKKLNDFQSKLYTDISHEFRTPLTLISGPIDVKLSEGGLSDTDYSNFSAIKRNTNRLINLVDQLLHLAKLQKGKLKLTVVKGNLVLFLGTLAKAFEYRAESRGIDFKIDIQNFGLAWYDEDAIEKIVTNLLSNAMKYCPEKGFCAFDTIKKEGKLVLNVTNTIEVDEEIDVEKIFARFYQENEYSEGVGVGLSLVKELVQLYQGEVSVQMESERTIRFQVVLPIEKADLVNAEILDSSLEKILVEVTNVIPEVDGTDSNGSESNDLRNELPILLIVEDHKEVREFISSMWKDRFHILEAENGKIGIKKALETIPDLIITDVRMPVCDGITLCNNLKTDERTSHIPIILLTAGAGEENELKGLTSGADDFITKPFKLRILQKRVENLIQTRKSLRSRYSQEVMLKAKDISVTPTDEIFLNKVQKVLDDRLSDPEFDSTLFCKLVGMSRMQLHRKLLALTGLSTTAFIRSQRLKQAVHILKTSDATVNEVAYTVGFNTPSYFIKCFKEVYQKTPAEYLQS
ncbi:MAG: two-component regulator propeller domain-containing protein, partial [Flavobacteriaceae bacterium]